MTEPTTHPSGAVVPEGLRRPRRLAELAPRPLVTLGAAGLAALLAVAALAPHPRLVTALVVAAAGLVVAGGLPRVLDLPSCKGTALVAALGAVATTCSVVLSDDQPPLRWLPVALAVSVVAAFAHQLLRVDGRPRVVASLSGSLLALALLAAGSLWVALVADDDGARLALAATAPLAASVLVEHLAAARGAFGALVPASLVTGGVVGAAVGAAVGVAVLPALGTGVLACAVACAVRAVLAPLPQLVARRAQLVSAMTSVLAAGAVVLLVAGWLPA